jgi:hypothetical protein
MGMPFCQRFWQNEAEKFIKNTIWSAILNMNKTGHDRSGFWGGGEPK